MPLTASHFKVISPAESVFSSRVLPSDFTIVPVSRSPFFSVTRSADVANVNKNIDAHAHNDALKIALLRTFFLPYLPFARQEAGWAMAGAALCGYWMLCSSEKKAVGRPGGSRSRFGYTFWPKETR